MKHRLLVMTGIGVLIPLLLLGLFMAWLTLTQGGLRWGLGYLTTLSGERLSYGTVEGTFFGPVSFKTLEYRDDGLTIAAGDVSLDWRPTALFEYKLAITSLDIGSLAVTVPTSRPEQGSASTTSAALPDFRLPIALSLDRIAINNIRIDDQKQQYNVQHLRVSATTLAQLITVDQLELESDTLSLKLSGTLRIEPTLPHKLSVDWRYRPPDGTVVSGQGRLVGDLGQTRLNQRLTNPIPLQVDADLHDLYDTPRGNILITHGRQQLRVQGQWSTLTESAILTLDWKNLAWPLTAAAPAAQINSPSGSGWLVGDLEHYEFGLAARLQSRQIDATAYTHGLGNTENLQLQNLRLESVAGTAIAAARINWSPTVDWQTKVTLAAVDPGHWLPDWPGQIGGTLTAHGSLADKQINALIDVPGLSGKLRGYPFSLRGQADWRDNTLTLNSIELNSGNSRARLSGEINDGLTLNWQVDSHDMAELLPDGGGSLHVEGRASGPRDTPRIEARVSGQSLKLSTYRLGTIDGTVDLDLQQPWQPLVNIKAEQLQLAESTLNSLTISSERQRLSITATTDQGNVDVILDGTADNTGWRGQISQADIRSPIIREWRLESATTIDINTTTGVNLAPLCWLGPEGRLCLSIVHQNDNWQASVDGTELPLALLDFWLPEGVRANGRGGLRADINATTAGLTGQANVTLTAGNIVFPVSAEEFNQWDFQSGQLAIDIDERGISARAELINNATDRVDASIDLPGAKLPHIDPARQGLQGQARLTTSELGLIDLLLTDIQGLKGRLTGDLSISGTLAEPRFGGRFGVDNGAMQIPRLGLTIQPIRIQGKTDASNHLVYQLEAGSGEGVLRINGQTALDAQNDWPTTLHLKGDSFEISHIPEARVLVSPELDVTLHDHELSVIGQVLIPYARLQPKDITTAAKVSDDVIIVNAEQVAQPRWRITANIRISLGDRVTLYGYGFDGRIAGAITLEDKPDQVTTASGELSVPEGTYRAYGQRLAVERGRLLFTGGPISNPGLDLRAVRHVDNVTAGLKVLGTLNQPRVELFSEPSMGETDTTAYLLLGRSLESSTGEDGVMLANAALALGLSSGDQLARKIGDRFGFDEMRVESNNAGDQASLVIGRYLSPRLYISYGVGLIDALNTFNVRYRISDKWQLKAETGEYQGADLLYTIER